MIVKDVLAAEFHSRNAAWGAFVFLERRVFFRYAIGRGADLQDLLNVFLAGRVGQAGAGSTSFFDCSCSCINRLIAPEFALAAPTSSLRGHNSPPGVRQLTVDQHTRLHAIVQILGELVDAARWRSIREPRRATCA